jgi:hypothetical protein
LRSTTALSNSVVIRHEAVRVASNSSTASYGLDTQNPPVLRISAFFEGNHEPAPHPRTPASAPQLQNDQGAGMGKARHAAALRRKPCAGAYVSRRNAAACWSTPAFDVIGSFVATNSGNSGNSGSSPAEDVLVNYFRAKDGNRPHLLERVFCAEAQLAVKNATAAIQFPALTRGREAIADVLVRNFGRDNDNVYSFYLSTPPTEEVERFTCRWLVGMTEKSSKSVRVGCGTYDWTLNFDPVPCATALVISIELMQVLPPQDAGRVIAWLERLPYPWASAQSVVSTAPAIELLQPVIDFLRHG